MVDGKLVSGRDGKSSFNQPDKEIKAVKCIRGGWSDISLPRVANVRRKEIDWPPALVDEPRAGHCEPESMSERMNISPRTHELGLHSRVPPHCM